MNAYDCPPGQTTLREADVLVFMGKDHVVRSVNDSGASIEPLTRNTKTFTPRFADKAVTITEPGKSITISKNVDKALLVARPGPDGLKDFLATRAPAQQEQTNNTGAETTGENSMAAKKKEVKKKARGGLAAEANGDASKNGHVGSLGDIFGFSATTIMRTLGMEGLTVKQVRGIMAARGVKCSDTTVNIQVAAGRNGKTAGKDSKPVTYATLTKAQLAELKEQAPADEPEAKEAK